MKQKTYTNPILLINSDYSVMGRITLTRAISLYMKEKVHVVLERENSNLIHPRLDIRYPSVVQMRHYQRMPHRKIPLTRNRVLARDHYVCQYCEKKLGSKGTIDHVIPKSSRNYPGNIWENVVACCERCNASKANRTPKEAGMREVHPKHPRIEELLIGNNSQWREYLNDIFAPAK